MDYNLLLDPYGQLIRPGKLVVYNYQGECRKGRVTNVTLKDPKKTYHWCCIEIQEHNSQKISKVGRPVNLVVIAE